MTDQRGRHAYKLVELAAALNRAADRLSNGDDEALQELQPHHLITMHTLLVSYGMAMDLIESTLEPMEES